MMKIRELLMMLAMLLMGATQIHAFNDNGYVYAGVGGGMIINTPAKVIKGDVSLIGETKHSIQPIFTWEVGGNIPFMEFLDTSFAISLNIAVRGAVNPMARKLDLHRFSSTHSVGIYMGITIIPHGVP